MNELISTGEMISQEGGSRFAAARRFVMSVGRFCAETMMVVIIIIIVKWKSDLIFSSLLFVHTVHCSGSA